MEGGIFISITLLFEIEIRAVTSRGWDVRVSLIDNTTIFFISGVTQATSLVGSSWHRSDGNYNGTPRRDLLPTKSRALSVFLFRPLFASCLSPDSPFVQGRITRHAGAYNVYLLLYKYTSKIWNLRNILYIYICIFVIFAGREMHDTLCNRKEIKRQIVSLKDCIIWIDLEELDSTFFVANIKVRVFFCRLPLRNKCLPFPDRSITRMSSKICRLGRGRGEIIVRYCLTSSPPYGSGLHFFFHVRRIAWVVAWAGGWLRAVMKAACLHTAVR